MTLTARKQEMEVGAPMPLPQLCPVCHCLIRDIYIIKDGVAYCCKPCATGGICECGCNMVAEPPQTEEAENNRGTAGQCHAAHAAPDLNLVYYKFDGGIQPIITSQ